MSKQRGGIGSGGLTGEDQQDLMITPTLNRAMSDFGKGELFLNRDDSYKEEVEPPPLIEDRLSYPKITGDEVGCYVDCAQATELDGIRMNYKCHVALKNELCNDIDNDAMLERGCYMDKSCLYEEEKILPLSLSSETPKTFGRDIDCTGFVNANPTGKHGHKSIEQMFDSIIRSLADTRISTSNTSIEQHMSSMGDNNSHLLGEDEGEMKVNEDSRTSEMSEPGVGGSRHCNRVVSDSQLTNSGCKSNQRKWRNETISSIQSRPKAESSKPKNGCNIKPPFTSKEKTECPDIITPYTVIEEETSICEEANDSQIKGLDHSHSHEQNRQLDNMSWRGRKRSRAMSLSLERARKAARNLFGPTRARSLSPSHTKSVLDRFLNSSKYLLRKSRHAIISLGCLSYGEKLEESEFSESHVAHPEKCELRTSEDKSSQDEEWIKLQILNEEGSQDQLDATEIIVHAEDNEENMFEYREKVDVVDTSDTSWLPVATLVGLYEEKITSHSASQTTLPKNLSGRAQICHNVDDITVEYLRNDSEENDQSEQESLCNEPAPSPVSEIGSLPERMNSHLLSSPGIEKRTLLKIGFWLQNEDNQFGSLKPISEKNSMEELEQNLFGHLPLENDVVESADSGGNMYNSDPVIKQHDENAPLTPSEPMIPEIIVHHTMDYCGIRTGQENTVAAESPIIKSEQSLESFQIASPDQSNTLPEMKVCANSDNELLPFSPEIKFYVDDLVDETFTGQTSKPHKDISPETSGTLEVLSSDPPPNSPKLGPRLGAKRVNTTISLFETRSALLVPSIVDVDTFAVSSDVKVSSSAEGRIGYGPWQEERDFYHDHNSEINVMTNRRGNELEVKIDQQEMDNEEMESGMISQPYVNLIDKEEVIAQHQCIEKSCDNSDDKSDQEYCCVMKDLAPEALIHEPHSSQDFTTTNDEEIHDDCTTENIDNDKGLESDPILSTLVDVKDRVESILLSKTVDPSSVENNKTMSVSFQNEEEGDSNKLNIHSDDNQKNYSGSKSESNANMLDDKCVRKTYNFLTFSKILEESETNEELNELPSPPSASPSSSSQSVCIPLKRCPYHENLLDAAGGTKTELSDADIGNPFSSRLVTLDQQIHEPGFNNKAPSDGEYILSECSKNEILHNHKVSDCLAVPVDKFHGEKDEIETKSYKQYDSSCKCNAIFQSPNVDDLKGPSKAPTVIISTPDDDDGSNLHPQDGVQQSMSDNTYMNDCSFRGKKADAEMNLQQQNVSSTTSDLYNPTSQVTESSDYKENADREATKFHLGHYLPEKAAEIKALGDDVPHRNIDNSIKSPRSIRWNVHATRQEASLDSVSTSSCEENSSTDKSNSCMSEEIHKWLCQSAEKMNLSNVWKTYVVREQQSMDNEDSDNKNAAPVYVASSSLSENINGNSSSEKSNKAFKSNTASYKVAGISDSYNLSLYKNKSFNHAFSKDDDVNLYKCITPEAKYLTTQDYSARPLYNPSNFAANDDAESQRQMGYLAGIQGLRETGQLKECFESEDIRVGVVERVVAAIESGSLTPNVLEHITESTDETKFKTHGKSRQMFSYSKDTLINSASETHISPTATVNNNSVSTKPPLNQYRPTILKKSKTFILDSSSHGIKRNRTRLYQQFHSNLLRYKFETTGTKIGQALDFVERARRRIELCDALIARSMNTLKKSSEISRLCRWHIECVDRLILHKQPGQ